MSVLFVTPMGISAPQMDDGSKINDKAKWSNGGGILEHQHPWKLSDT